MGKKSVKCLTNGGPGISCPNWTNDVNYVKFFEDLFRSYITISIALFLAFSTSPGCEVASPGSSACFATSCSIGAQLLYLEQG